MDKPRPTPTEAAIITIKAARQRTIIPDNMEEERFPMIPAYESVWNLSSIVLKKACYKPKFATGSALEAYRAYSDLGGEL